MPTNMRHADKMPSVYLVKSGKHYKIGFSSDIDKRLKNLDANAPMGVKLIWRFRSKYAEYLERLLHYYLMDKHLRREWFTLTNDDVDFIKEIVPQINREEFIASVWPRIYTELLKSPIYYQWLNLPVLPAYEWINPKRDKKLFNKFL
jgi:hypothetical protein